MMATNGITSILDVVKALSIDVRREYGNEIVGPESFNCSRGDHCGQQVTDGVLHVRLGGQGRLLITVRPPTGCLAFQGFSSVHRVDALLFRRWLTGVGGPLSTGLSVRPMGILLVAQ